MRLVIVGPFPRHPSAPDGGVEASTSDLILGLRTLDRGVHVDVITLDDSATKDRTVNWNGAVVHYLHSPRRLLTTTRYYLPRRRIRALVSEIEPDVVHAQGTQMFGDIGLSLGYPLLVSVHGIVDEELKYLDNPIAKLRRRLQSQVQRRVIRKARHLYQPGGYPMRHFGGLAQGNWHTGWNPVSDGFFAVEPSRAPATILFVGAVTRLKGVMDLVEAASKLLAEFPRLEVRVAGGFREPAYLETLQARVRQLHLERQVSLLGPLRRADLIEEYSRCSVLVLPSYQENSPMAVAEAMAAATPVIATRVGGVADMVDDGMTGLLYSPGAIELLAEHLRRVLRDPVAAAHIGEEARHVAEDRFRPSKVATRLLDVYQQVIDDHG